MNLEFVVEKDYILLKMLCNVGNLNELNNWRKNIFDDKVLNNLLNEVSSKVEEYYSRGNFNGFIVDNKLESKIKALKEDKLFKKYYQETLDYMNNVRKYWLKNKDEINDYLENIIKIKMDFNDIKVIMAHPYLNAGVCVDNKNIFFGHWKGIKDLNYNIVYLCHEYLHILLPNENCNTIAMRMYYDKAQNGFNKEHWNYLLNNIENYYENFDYEEKIIHSIIELVSDNELYTRLSGESMYSLGHNEPNYSLVEYKEVLLPYWFKYINMSKEGLMLRKGNYKESIVTLDKDINDLNSFINFILSNRDIRENLGIKKLGNNNKESAINI